MQNKIGSKIKNLRKQKGYNLKKLAALTDSCESYIWRLENKNTRFSIEKLSKIADQLDTTVEYLIDIDSNITLESASDIRFYREYQKMDDNAKSKVRWFVKLCL